jgi:hypothetical protein
VPAQRFPGFREAQVPASGLEFARFTMKRSQKDSVDWMLQNRWKLLAATIGPSEVRLTERRLAAVRASLAASAFIAVLMYPIQNSSVHWLLLIYVIHSFSVMVVLKFNKRSSPAFQALIYSVDLMWPPLLYAFPVGRNLFSVFLVFVLATAAEPLIDGRSVRKHDRTENTGPMVPSQRDVMPTLRGDF